jgi:ribosomal protein S18 acetylase RimI-like enzyme
MLIEKEGLTGKNTQTHRFAYTQGRKSIGTVTMKCIKHLAELEHLYVSTEYRRRGVGKKLLEKSEEFAKTHGLKKLCALVRDDNTTSISLFRSCGFEVEGVMKDHFEEGVDILIFSKFL